MKNIENLIHEKCANATGNIYDIYYALYMDFLSEDKTNHPSSVLQKLLEEVSQHEFEDDNNSKYISEEDIEENVAFFFWICYTHLR